MGVGTGSFPIAVATKRGLTFFSFDGMLKDKRGMFNGNKMQTMCSVAYFDNDSSKVASGSSSGDIYLWSGNGCTKVINNLCRGGIHAITIRGDNLYTSGYKDKLLQICDLDCNA